MIARMILGAACLVAAASVPALAADPQIVADAVYGHKDGMALTYDVIAPEKPNGAAILWIQSGGWYSSWTDPKAMAVAGKPYLDKGYTLIIVRHGSAPKYGIADDDQGVPFVEVRFARDGNGLRVGPRGIP